MSGSPDRPQPEPPIGRVSEEGKIVLGITASRDISKYVRGDRPLAEFVRMTVGDLEIRYSGAGNFTLISPSPDSIRSFLEDKTFSAGKRTFEKGSFIPLPQVNSSLNPQKEQVSVLIFPT